MYKRTFKDYINNRKLLYIMFIIALISVSTLTIVYAALNVTLNIVGTADISAASWDVHLDNINVNTQSVSGNTPTITGGTTATFSTKLEVPGDFYEFTVDVVNDGTIDAMIESIVKTPTLTTVQAKYLKYEVEYQNGESINTRQLVEKNSFVRLKVRVEFRKDIIADDLPSTAETLNLSFTVVYTQSDGTGNNVMDGGVTKAKVISGDYDTVGSEICIQDECFYVISSDTDSVTMLAKYNLNVGYIINYVNVQEVPPGSSNWIKTEDKSLITAIVKQDDSALGFSYESDWVYKFPIVGTTPFSNDSKKGVNYSDYEGSIVESYVDEYDSYLSNLGVILDDVRLISYDELIELGCENEIAEDNWGRYCTNAPSWVTSTSYWTGTPDLTEVENYTWYDPYLEKNIQYDNGMNVWTIGIEGPHLTSYHAEYYFMYGVRPVITIAKTQF